VCQSESWKARKNGGVLTKPHRASTRRQPRSGSSAGNPESRATSRSDVLLVTRISFPLRGAKVKLASGAQPTQGKTLPTAHKSLVKER
jgi:hypothetical protein